MVAAMIKSERLLQRRTVSPSSLARPAPSGDHQTAWRALLHRGSLRQAFRKLPNDGIEWHANIVEPREIIPWIRGRRLNVGVLALAELRQSDCFNPQPSRLHYSVRYYLPPQKTSSPPSTAHSSFALAVRSLLSSCRLDVIYVLRLRQTLKVKVTPTGVSIHEKRSVTIRRPCGRIHSDSAT